MYLSTKYSCPALLVQMNVLKTSSSNFSISSSFRRPRSAHQSSGRNMNSCQWTKSVRQTIVLAQILGHHHPLQILSYDQLIDTTSWYYSLSRPQVDHTFQRFRFLAPCQRLRAIVCVLSAHLRDDKSSICVCLRLREQCLLSEITPVARVVHVLLLRSVAGNVGVNTLASKRSQLIGNAAIVRKRCVIHKKSTCVCLRLSVAAFTRKRMDARFDLWPALDAVGFYISP